MLCVEGLWASRGSLRFLNVQTIWRQDPARRRGSRARLGSNIGYSMLMDVGAVRDEGEKKSVLEEDRGVGGGCEKP